ncbi:MAG: lipase family protein [Nitrospinales bacterium]
MNRIFSITLFLLCLGITGCGTHSHTHSDGQVHLPDGSHVEAFAPTEADKVNLVMAYLSYIGEQLTDPKNETKIILNRINNVMNATPQLWGVRPNQSDWEVVWGPAIYTFFPAKYQDNGMFVARQKSNPANYIVAIRGTNFIAVLDWVLEDFDVLFTREWVGGSGSPRISEATHLGVYVLYDDLIPNPGLPGENQSLRTFLKAAAKDHPINVSFTGHSLGGALAPTLALLFAQDQGQAEGWDPNNHARISSTSFAGATAGNADFAAQSLKVLGKNMRRIQNMNDVVPHAWQTSTMNQLEGLYSSSGIEMPWEMKGFLKLAIDFTKDKDYTQINYSIPFTYDINKDKDTYKAQMGYQHSYSYPLYLLGPKAGLNLINLVDANK